MSVRATYFSAPWCMPCKNFKPIAFGKMTEAGVRFEEINVDENIELVGALDVMSLPTIIFENGEDEFARVIGASSKQLQEALDKSMRYVV